jgi:8-amino-7-oxononanoate synthase
VTTGRSSWKTWVDEQCRTIRSAGRWRQVATFDAAGTTGTLRTGDGPRTGVVSFASNDYLGLTRHPRVQAAATDAIERWGTGSGASRLVVGSRPVHDELETAIARWRGCESALLFPTGYAANTGTLAALAGPGTRICSDELNHASLVDGCRLAAQRGAEVRVYRHADIDDLESHLSGTHRSIVVSDTVFSMDGDLAPVEALAARCARHGALLVLDDAHVVFPIPPPDVPTGVDILRIGTLSKALGSLGGYVAGPRPFVELLINRARPFIFTTAPSPADSAAALAALAVVRSEEGGRLLRLLRSHIDILRPGHPTPIIPILVGLETDALAASEGLADRGFLVPAIRPPTVPEGTSRLRVTVSAAHSTAQVEGLASALSEMGLLEPVGLNG